MHIPTQVYLSGLFGVNLTIAVRTSEPIKNRNGKPLKKDDKQLLKGDCGRVIPAKHPEKHSKKSTRMLFDNIEMAQRRVRANIRT